MAPSNLQTTFELFVVRGRFHSQNKNERTKGDLALYYQLGKD